jgi:ADP-ribose pyrophosphatase
MYKKPWRIRDSEVAHKNPYFSVLRQHVEVAGSNDRTYYTIAFPRPAVGVLATRAADILLIRQYRFIVDEYVWAIPSGGTDASETPAEAAARELREETGYTAAKISPFMNCYASYGCSNQRFEIFLAEELSQAAGFDTAEVLEIRWFTRNEAVEMVEANAIVDNLSLSPILLFLLRTRSS